MATANPQRELDSWVQATLPHAVVYARSLLRDKLAAEDVVHDCFCRLLRKADLYDLPNDGTKLLYRSITNACINRTQREKPVLSLAGSDSTNDLNGQLADGKAADPQEMAKASELGQAIERGLAKLSVTQRAAIELKSLGHSLQDIADTLGLTVSNVGVLIHRARQTMSVDLAPYLNEPDE